MSSTFPKHTNIPSSTFPKTTFKYVIIEVKISRYQIYKFSLPKCLPHYSMHIQNMYKKNYVCFFKYQDDAQNQSKVWNYILNLYLKHVLKAWTSRNYPLVYDVHTWYLQVEKKSPRSNLEFQHNFRSLKLNIKKKNLGVDFLKMKNQLFLQ